MHPTAAGGRSRTIRATSAAGSCRTASSSHHSANTGKELSASFPMDRELLERNKSKDRNAFRLNAEVPATKDELIQ